MSVNSIEPLIRTAKNEEDITAGGQIVTKTVKLVRSRDGYGMYLREACPVEKVASFVPTETKPSTQLIIDVDEGGVAEKAGLQAGDFVIEVNNEDVRRKPHTVLLKLIGSLKTEVVLKVVHVPKFKVLSFEAKQFKSANEAKNSGLVNSPSSSTDSLHLSVSQVNCDCLDQLSCDPKPDLPLNIAVLHGPPQLIETPSSDDSNQSGSTSPSLSARRRRIKVLPKSETDDLKPDQVFEVSAGDDPNVKKETSGMQKPVKILPTNCDAATIWEQAKAMQARRKGSNPSDANDDSFLPETAPEQRDDDSILQVCRDHPYKWDVHQTSVWVKTFGLPPNVAEAFEYNEVKGEHLKYLSKEDLRSIGITERQTLNRLAKEIENLLMKYESGGHI